jgi:hypothetical protein
MSVLITVRHMVFWFDFELTACFDSVV